MASSTALALDAADGVIDGRHFGRPIVQAGPQFQGGFAQPAFASYGATTVAPGFGTTFGAPVFGGQTFGATQFVGGASSTAAALDAADGVIDGRHFGRPIVQAGAPVIQGAPSFVQAAPVIGAPAFASYGATTVGGPVFGGQTFGATQFVGGASSTAAALDAADGVIDGRHFGRPIVQAGAPGGLVPYTGAAQFQSVPAFGGQYFGGQRFVGGYAAPQFGGAVPVQQYAGYGYPQQFGATQQFGAFGAQSRAAQLDAADGVMDGRYYGRPIVQRR